ncbi:Ankyrin repeat and SOCS box protein 2 [Penaeus vannamei]|uniref:Ankyrin repeat and SOCS box protein 2 n=1 Tax=Penaeus vannamei TaxID=6689 RepID=A0A423U020_PENVA|nr:Ankyrin repeat and SOCS box protein 2 [Penaeus vannamei]
MSCVTATHSIHIISFEHPLLFFLCSHYYFTLSHVQQRDLAGAGDGQALRSALASLPPRAKKDFLGRHLLHEAAEEGREEVVEILVEAGADVNAKGSEGRTPLHEASSSGQEGVAEILTANGADLNAKTDDGSTPLYLASLNGHVAVVETLARKGADLDEKKSEGFAPLHRAAQYGHVEVIKLLPPRERT